jgi:integrase
MPRAARELAPIAVAGLKKPGRYSVGVVPGLYLQVLPTGGRTWVLRARIGTHRREIGLGGFPDVTLAQARTKARELRDEIRAGRDPIQEKRSTKSATLADQLAQRTFRQCALAYIESQEAGWRNAKHAQQWRNTLEQHVYPRIGNLLIRDVSLPHVLEVLRPIWTTKNETASRLRGRIEAVLDWATVHKYRQGDNPARWKGHLDKLLPRPGKVAKVDHHRAIPVGEVGAFMQRLRDAEGMGALALEFAILTAARSGEARGARYSEIDRKAKVWTIPANRMKAEREHRVPLSQAALNAIDRAAALPRIAGSDLLFPAPRGGQLSDMTLTAAMRRMNLDAVPHGFRSTFRDWAAERTNYPREVAEAALAHVIADKVEAAYRRGDLFEKRKRMMDDWSDFLSRVETVTDNVIPLNRSAK